MAIKPILFSTPMVQAIMFDCKNQTRRLIKKKYSNTDIQIRTDNYGSALVEMQNDVPEPVKNEDGTTTYHMRAYSILKPKYNKGDILWVRETWRWSDALEDFCYKANSENPELSNWKPSIFMPKDAARIFLKVTGIKAERLHDISEADAISEGIEKLPVWKNRVVENLYTNYMKDGRGPQTPRLSFFSLWESINGKESLASNPWVWVYDFTKVEKPANFI